MHTYTLAYMRAQRLRMPVTMNRQAVALRPCALIAFSVNLLYEPLCGRINFYSVRTNPVNDNASVMQEDELVTSHWRAASLLRSRFNHSQTAVAGRVVDAWSGTAGLHAGARSILQLRRCAVVMVMAASVQLATRLGLYVHSQVHYT